MSVEERIVADASVILKWVLDSDDERDLEEAGELLDGWKHGTLEILVPSLWIYEVGNIFCLKRPDDAEEVLLGLRDLELIEAPAGHSLEREAAAISIGYGVTFYDASYLAVARLNDATLITADVRFARKLPADTPVRCLGSASKLN